MGRDVKVPPHTTSRPRPAISRKFGSLIVWYLAGLVIGAAVGYAIGLAS